MKEVTSRGTGMSRFGRRTLTSFAASAVLALVAAAQTPPPTWFASRVGAVDARWDHALADDPNSGDLYCLGGFSTSGAPPNRVLRTGSNQWASWTASGTTPRARGASAMAYDPAAHAILVFGGLGSLPITLLGDTWSFDIRTSTWTDRTSSGDPSPRQFHGMTLDTTRNEILMYGGRDANNTQLDETWVYANGGWSQRHPATSPGGTHTPLLTFDESRGVAVLFEDGETWEWDGSDWARFQGTSPFPLVEAAMSYDPRRRRVVLAGGRNPFIGYVQQTWEFDGTTWTLIVNGGSQPRVARSAMAFSSGRRHLVLVGGQPRLFSGTGQCWEAFVSLSPNVRSIGVGCAGPTNLSSTFGAQPWAGEPFDLTVSGLDPSASAATLLLGSTDQSWFGSFPLPRPLDFLGMTGCTLYVQGDLAEPLSVGAGTATVSLPIPFELIGTTFFAQGFALQPSANPLGISASNAIRALVGGR